MHFAIFSSPCLKMELMVRASKIKGIRKIDLMNVGLKIRVEGSVRVSGLRSGKVALIGDTSFTVDSCWKGLF